MARFEERSYSGNLFRPKPLIHKDEDNQLLIIATPWGNRSGAQKVINIFSDLYLSSKADHEATSPFAIMTCLSPLGNSLRVATMLANDTLYHDENREEYQSAVELTVIARSGSEVAWIQIGQPHLFLDRNGLDLQALGSPSDMALDYPLPHGQAPLPCEFIGLSSTSNFSVHSIKHHPNDRFILLSRSVVPASFYNMVTEKRNLESITDHLADKDTEMPFWLGVYEI